MGVPFGDFVCLVILAGWLELWLASDGGPGALCARVCMV